MLGSERQGPMSHRIGVNLFDAVTDQHYTREKRTLNYVKAPKRPS